LKWKHKEHTLEDIRRYLTYIPPIFILIFTLFAISVVIVVNDFKKESSIRLLTQKHTLSQKFELQQSLDDFVVNIEQKVRLKHHEEENELKQNLFEILGYAKIATIPQLDAHIDKVEDDGTLKVVLFDSKDFSVIHGHSTVRYLQNLIFSNTQNDAQKKTVLQYIYSQGDRNFQYWKDDRRNTYRLSYFHSIEGSTLYVGIFSTVDSLRYITQKTIMEHIDQTISASSYKYWFYDYAYSEVYSFDYPSTLTHIYELDSKLVQNGIIKHYRQTNIDDKERFANLHNYRKFNFLVVIEPQKNAQVELFKAKKAITLEIKQLVRNQIYLIAATALILLLASVLFSRFITVIIVKYNQNQKKQNELLTEWKERYKLAIIASNDGFWDINLDNWEIYFSKRWYEMYGYQEGDVNNFDEWLSLVHKEDRRGVKELFDMHLQGKSDNFIGEYRLKTKQNRYKWVLARGKVFWDQKRMLMMSMDIDKPKKMQTELEEAERLVEDGRIVIFRWRPDDNLSVEYVSKSIRNYGYSQKNIENSHYIDIVYEEDKRLLLESIKEAIAQDQTFFFSSYRIIDGSGEIKWIFSRAIIIKDDFGKVTHFYGYIHDITKIKLSEEELKRQVADEVEKNIQKDRLLVQQSKLASMGEMLGSIAHQWRQPLNNVSLILHFLKDNFDSDALDKAKLEGFVKRAKEQIDYMSDTIDDFKNFFRPSKSKEPFLASDAIRASLSIIGVQLHTHDIGVSLSLEDILVSGYENEFKQAILNIISNAKDAIMIRQKNDEFTPKIIIKTKKQEDKCLIVIENNGGTVDDEVKQKMFDPYFTTKFEHKGTGIGLYMCKTIIEGNMGGSIRVKNKKNGVVFEILLPICYNACNINITKDLS
jgi:PAS domain S-box-containing protein